MKLKKILAVVMTSSILLFPAISQAKPTPDKSYEQEATQSALWMSYSTEYQALCYQAYNAAYQVAEKAAQEKHDKPLALVLDCDETILNNMPYFAAKKKDPKKSLLNIWDGQPAWADKNQVPAMPGSVDFMKKIDALGIQIFYVTNRGEEMRISTEKNLRDLGFPQIEKSHVLLRDTTSNKQPRFDAIEKTHDVIIYMGDSMTDFPLDLYGKNFAENAAAAKKNQNLFGAKLIILPNPLYGAWEQIFIPNYKKMTDKEKIKARKKFFEDLAVE